MRWTADQVDAASLQTLLAALGSTPQEQADAYETLRERLRIFFSSRAAVNADRLADEVLSRLAYKLTAGIEVQKSLAALALGMARMVWLENRRQEIRDSRAAKALVPPAAFDYQREIQLEAMESCLDRLPVQDREDVLEYHRHRGRMKTDSRRGMAERIGVTANALRLRMMRLRRQLGSCVEATLATWDGAERHPMQGGGEDS
ncbi:MAG: hypothetical protein AAF654_10860 [Myxococcota bacterium]